MITCQHEWIKQCQLKYRWEELPEGEHWEDAHYPIPLCLGGTETVRLWSRDHAVHGVLQSIDSGYPCLHGYRCKTDRGLLSEHHPEYIALFDQELFKLRQLAGKSGGKVTATLGKLAEARAKIDQDLLQAARVRTGLQNVERGFFTPGHPNCILSFEYQSAAGKKGGAITFEKKVGIHDPKYLGVGGKIGGKIGSANTNSQMWRCTVTGFISKPGPLTRYQNKRGIDPSNRVRVE